MYPGRPHHISRCWSAGRHTPSPPPPHLPKPADIKKPARPWIRTANPHRLYPMGRAVFADEEREGARRRLHVVLECCCLSPAPRMGTACCPGQPSAALMVQVQALVLLRPGRIEEKDWGGVVAWRFGRLSLRRRRQARHLLKPSMVALRPSER